MSSELTELARLVMIRDAVDDAIAEVINRPAERSHVGEFIARRVFGITEPRSATRKGSDGEFTRGRLKGCTVNIKFYGKDDGVWDIRPYGSVDYYLVLTGAKSGAGSSRGTTRPLVIKHVFLMPENALKDAGVKPGSQSVKQGLRRDYQIYPSSGAKAVMTITKKQREMIERFAR